MSSQSDIIIIGGGASGLVAGITAARLGKAVTILEHKDKIGKKILATGNGKCNFTNLNQSKKCYRGDDPEFAMAVLNQFGLNETLSFFKELGIYPKSKNGYYYPNSEQASSILEVIQLELSHLKVKVKCNEHVVKVEKRMEGFAIRTSTYEYQANKVILATGGCASSELGSDGSGYAIAKQLGHQITELVPALTSLRSKSSFFKDLAGVRVEAVIKLCTNDFVLSMERGELQLTNYGISGIPIFQMSRFAAKELSKGEHISAFIDFMPELTNQELYELLEDRCVVCKHKTMEEQCIGLLNKKLANVLIKEAGIKPNTLGIHLTKEQLHHFIHFIKNFKVNISEPNTFANAQVTAGGVVTSEIDSDSLESKLVPGVYLCGEVIDIDGTCGGYNLQWAWSTGYLAGKHAATK